MKKIFTIALVMLFAFSMSAQNFELAPKSKSVNQNLVETESMQKSSVKGVIFEDDFEASSGWTLEAPFEIGTASIEPDAAHSGTEILGGPLNGDYPNDQTQVSAISPVIDCSGETVVLFGYWSFSGCESSTFDRIAIEVFDGSSWNQIWSNTDWGGSVQEDEWTYYEFDVTTHAAGNADFQVRYSLGTTDGSVQYSGWGIDDFKLFYPEPHDLGVTAIAPTFVNSGETVTPQVTIQNFGGSDENSYDVTLTIDDGYDQTVNLTNLVSFGNIVVVDMPDWTPADGTYNMTATVTVADDANAVNDEMVTEATIAGFQDAYAGNTTAGTYNEILLSDGTLNQVGAIGSSPFPMAEEYNGTTIYRVNSDMTFGTVGPDGTYTNIGTLTGFAGTPTGLAWDWDNEVMYVMMLDGSNLPNLCTLDMGTLALTQVGSAGTAMTIAIDFANDGYIYGTALNDESLYQYDPATGAETLIGPTGLTDLNYGQDVSFDAQDNLLYTISCGSDYKFGTIDLATGVFTEILDMVGDQYGTFVITKEPLTTYTITFDVEAGNGAITATAEGVDITSGDNVLENSEVIFTANPDAGWKVADWYVDGSPIGATDLTYTIALLDASVEVTVEFVETTTTYPVTFDVEAGNGAITATAEGNDISSGDDVLESSEVIFTATPDAGWEVADWYVDGSPIGATDPTYTIATLDATVDVTVEFTEITYTVTFTLDDGTDPLNGVNITIDSQDLTTDASGVAAIELANGNYPWTATLAGYNEETGTANVNGAAQGIDISMDLTTYTVTFTVIDADETIEGATVTFDGDEYTTDADGTVVITDVIDGTYAYSVTIDGYNTETGEIVVDGIDVEKTITLSITGINKGLFSNLQVYPNPFNKEIIITNADKVNRVVITNVNGQQVMDITLNGTKTINTSKLTSGIYLVTFEKMNGDRAMLKMVKK